MNEERWIIEKGAHDKNQGIGEDNKMGKYRNRKNGFKAINNLFCK